MHGSAVSSEIIVGYNGHVFGGESIVKRPAPASCGKQRYFKPEFLAVTGKDVEHASAYRTARAEHRDAFDVAHTGMNAITTLINITANIMLSSLSRSPP